jgi:hypothetical protein
MSKTDTLFKRLYNEILLGNQLQIVLLVYMIIPMLHQPKVNLSKKVYPSLIRLLDKFFWDNDIELANRVMAEVLHKICSRDKEF